MPAAEHEYMVFDGEQFWWAEGRDHEGAIDYCIQEEFFSLSDTLQPGFELKVWRLTEPQEFKAEITIGHA